MAGETESSGAAARLQLDAVLDTVLAAAGRIFQGEGGSVMLRVGDAELEVIASPMNPAALGARVRFGDGVAGRVAESCDAVLVSGRAGNRSQPIDSGMCVPLMHEGRIFGVLNINGGAGRAFTDHDLVAATKFGVHAAAALAAARSYEVDRREGAEQPERHLAQMLQRLAAAASVDFTLPARSEVVDLGRLARSVAAETEREGRPTGVRGPSSVRVLGREADLRRLLRELVDNGHRHGEPPVRLIFERLVDRISLTVVDSGPGVPAPRRAEVLEPFARLGRASDGAGLGLGLTIAKRLVSSMGGTLTIGDTPVGGAAFVVRLPPAP